MSSLEELEKRIDIPGKKRRVALALVLKNEKNFQAFTQKKADYQLKKASFYIYLGIGLVLTLIVYIFIEVQFTISRPINDLSSRMQDFLGNRYSFKYEMPKNNELGDLQRVFNDLAQRVLKNMDELQTLDHAKSEFLSIASHELRTPLTSIKGSLSLLRAGLQKDLPESSFKLFSIAQDETERLIRLINDLLDLAKIEAGKLPLNREWFSLNGLAEHTLDSLKGFSVEAGVPLEFNMEQPIDLYIDQDRVQQVLTNLLSNAIKFSPPDRPVELITRFVDVNTDETHIEIGIRDKGKGIAPEDQATIFQKFRQATSSTSRLVKGTGLGLAIAKAIIEEHGGEIGVRSAPEKGSTFFFTLPTWRPAQLENSDTQLERETA